MTLIVDPEISASQAARDEAVTAAHDAYGELVWAIQRCERMRRLAEGADAEACRQIRDTLARVQHAWPSALHRLTTTPESARMLAASAATHQALASEAAANGGWLRTVGD